MTGDRLFVAVWPPASLVAQLREQPRPDRAGLRWTTEDQWHITVRFLGPVEVAEQPTLLDRVADAAARTRPTAVVAGPRPQVLGRAVWVLPVAGLETVAATIERLTGEIGQPPGHRRFHGHLTLARARLPSALAGLPAGELLDRWTVDEITLVASDLRPDGARYQVVGRWPLASG
jgi:2'-5' RNA ligase